jgi:hypothetical protein
MSTWSEERRANAAAEAEQRRLDQDAAAERRAKARAAEDQRRRENETADKAARRAERLQRRRDRRDRRRERAASWTKATTPQVLYRRGTVALVTASALASLPAQVAHFAGISLMLLPLPFALEGAAWVMAAGVAYADERGLPGWVRWLLRALCLSAASFAAFINYQYGSAKAPAAGYGLAAVSLLGPLFFEVRQWVSAMSAVAVSPKEKAEARARAAHAKRRAKDHKAVVKLADRLMSAAPYGSLSQEDAFAAAWEITSGTRVPGMTPELHAQAALARRSLSQALAQTGMSPEEVAVELFLAEVFGAHRDDDGPAGGVAPTTPKGGPKTGPRGATGGPHAAEKPQVGSQLSPASGGAGKGSGTRPTPVPPKRRKGDAPRYNPAARREASREAKGRRGEVTES